MKFAYEKNPSPARLAEMLAEAHHGALRRIVDQRTGDIYVWDAALATHAEGASRIGIPYDTPAGQGEIIIQGQ